MKCHKCGDIGGQNFVIVKKVRYKLICVSCGAFVKIVSKAKANKWPNVAVIATPCHWDKLTKAIIENRPPERKSGK